MGLAQALNPLIDVPEEDLQPNVRTTMQFARLLNEARGIVTTQSAECAECGGKGKIKLDVPDRELKAGDDCPDCLPSRDFLDRCTKQLGPIIEARVQR